jgi:AAA domain-containing protein/CHC2-type zinc finger protein
MSRIAEAKRRLPLPALLHREGLGAHAKKSARCPFHDDKHNSFSVWKNGAGIWFFKCHAGCGEGDEINFLKLHKHLSRSNATKLFVEMADLNGSAPARNRADGAPLFDWDACVAAFTDEDIEWLADWRGYSGELCSWLKQNKFIGLYDNCVAFPVHDRAGNVVAAHYRQKDGSWRYYPQGAKVRPLVIGELVAGELVHIFESQCDAFAFMDASGERGGIIITRGASNGALVSDLIAKSSIVYVWTQNDAAGAKWERDITGNTKCAVKRCKIPSPRKDLNDWTRAGATANELLDAILNAETLRELPKSLIEFRSPLQLKNFEPPPGIILAGDCHIVRGSVFVIGGAPGVGKSRAAVALAEAGATQHEWFGLPVRRQFKTMIVQTENGEFRLSREFGELDCEALENFVRVCPPPPYGLCFARDGFREQLAAAVAAFAPDVVIYDPWNAAAREQDSREYLDTFDALRSVLPFGDDAPALGIVAHTRKPKTDERASGRALLNLLAGSYVLGSVPRTVFVMQAASDETTDNRVVWTCCKNNDGELGVRSAWERRNGLFAPVRDFDWEAFDAPEKDRRELISETDVAAIFRNGELRKAEAVKRLQSNTGAHRASCYRALEPNGRFARHLVVEGEGISWK